jgi:hypothetical protein
MGKRHISVSRRHRSATSMSRREPNAILTMKYYGKDINIPFDTDVFDAKDEISIYQQHCGGENLLVYEGFHEAGGYYLNI